MNAVEFVNRVVEALERLQIEYMAVGSFSVNVYATPRSTNDADFVVELGTTPISKLMAELGHDFALEEQMSFETVTSTLRYRLRHRETLFLIELFLLSGDAHDRQRFARRIQGEINGHKTFVPTAEDVIIQKLRWSKQGQRQKDVEDCRAILAVQAGRLDLPYIRLWSDQHVTRKLFEQLFEDSVRFGNRTP